MFNNCRHVLRCTTLDLENRKHQPSNQPTNHSYIFYTIFPEKDLMVFEGKEKYMWGFKSNKKFKLKLTDYWKYGLKKTWTFSFLPLPDWLDKVKLVTGGGGGGASEPGIMIYWYNIETAATHFQ